jgi:bidirectional [NiFe] hydrogenase diaphorase subunit
VKGAGQILQALEQKHGIKAGETTEDGKVSLVTARCGMGTFCSSQTSRATS